MRGLPRTIWVLGWVSFFTDFSSEMIYPLLPVFLAQSLGAGALALGTIEGVAQTTAAVLKAASGVWADRLKRRKPFLVAGYGLAGFVRPLIAFAVNWPMVLFLRFLDRFGKGVRTSPRDALIADVSPRSSRGTAFGVQRAMDHAGAIVGPLVAAVLLTQAHLTLRLVFLLAAIPALIAFLVLTFGLKEPPAAVVGTSPPNDAAQGFQLRRLWDDAPNEFRIFLVCLLIFTIGNSADAFLILRLRDAEVGAAAIATLWAAQHVVRMCSSYLWGRFSDRTGRKHLILAGWFLYAILYIAFALVESRDAVIATFILYGVFIGLTEPAERAFIADLAPPSLRGTAYGCYHLVLGVGLLPASLLFGMLWESLGRREAFLFSAICALVAGFALHLLLAREHHAG